MVLFIPNLRQLLQIVLSIIEMWIRKNYSIYPYFEHDEDLILNLSLENLNIGFKFSFSFHCECVHQH